MSAFYCFIANFLVPISRNESGRARPLNLLYGFLSPVMPDGVCVSSITATTITPPVLFLFLILPVSISLPFLPS